MNDVKITEDANTGALFVGDKVMLYAREVAALRERFAAEVMAERDSAYEQLEPLLEAGVVDRINGRYEPSAAFVDWLEALAAEPHTTDARDAVATIRAHSMLHEGVCLTENDVDAIVSELNRLAAERTPKNMHALVEEARTRSEQRWPIPANYLEGDPERILLDAQRHAYLLGQLDAAEQPAAPTPSEVIDWIDNHLPEPHNVGDVLVAADEHFADLVSPAAEQPATPTPSTDPETLARAFHENYERLAPEFGYSTRKRSAVPWDDVPDDNKALMVATARAVLAALVSPVPEQPAPLDPEPKQNVYIHGPQGAALRARYEQGGDHA